MEVSIVVPVYNVKNYLMDCLDSCLLKTEEYADSFEIILLDDGSTDGSERICDKYADLYNNIRVIHQNNQGLSSARNRGIECARGRYVQFLDSDDWLEPETFVEYLKTLKTLNTDVVLINYIEKYPEKSVIPKSYCRHENFPCEVKDLQECILQGMVLPGMAQCYVVKKEFITARKLSFKEGILHEDQLWTALILFYADTCAVFEPVLYDYRRVRKGSIMNTVENTKRIKGMETVVKELINIYEEAETEKGLTPKKYIGNRLGSNMLLLYTMAYASEKKEKIWEIEDIIIHTPTIKQTIATCSRLSRLCMKIPSAKIALRVYAKLRPYPLKQ